ncbi:acyclic terpene utilization AtuA family protein [Dactylosporangium sp. NPDC051484]|uniref:acyclic terpene utilization AtuA family protein n=1 Tax=Dactylosporangium sp. NPDC051484 TaxID=3154942 RepID=UPI00344FA473
MNYFAGLVREIAKSQNQAVKLALIYSEVTPEAILDKLKAGRLEPLAPAPTYDEAEILRSSRIVAVMGVEPIQRAIESGADIILAGRATDPAIFAALPMMRGVDPGLAWHAGKVAEYGASAAEPRGPVDLLRVELESTSFVVRALADNRRCTPASVSAVQLYEVGNPHLMIEPGWTIDLREITYQQVTDDLVRVTSGKGVPQPYTNKLEGVTAAGFQKMFTCAIRDSTILECLDSWLADLEESARDRCRTLVGADAFAQCKVTTRVYGRDGVLGERERRRPQTISEVALIIDVISPNADDAADVIEAMHYVYMHSKSPAWSINGTLAFPFAQRIFDLGEVYEFNVHHVVHVDSPDELFRLHVEDVTV